MTATRKGDTHSLLLLLQLLRFNIKNTDRNKNKKNTDAEKWGVMWKMITMRMNQQRLTFMLLIENKMSAVENSHCPTILDRINWHHWK